MSLIYNPEANKIFYEDKEVGEYTYQDGKSIVTLNMVYECPPGDWVVPLSWFAHGLSLMHQHQRPQPDLVLESEADSIEKEFEVPRLLTERTVKQNGFVWHFYKNDVDLWPSPLHGHDYDRGLKLDAITGHIYDVTTKACCKILKEKNLKKIQEDLRDSKDFSDKVLKLIDVQKT